MATYRELLARVRAEIDEISTHRGARAPRARPRPPLRRRARAGRVGGGSHPGRDLHRPRPARVADRGPGPGQEPRARRLLLRRQPLGLRGEGARRSSATRTSLNLAGGFTDWKRNGFEVTIPRVALAGAALALQPSPPHPRGRRGGTAAPARRARPARRRRRPRLARVALPRRRRRRHARDRRRGRRRRVEPPAPDRPLDRPPRRAEGALRQAHARGAQPGRARRPVPGAPDLARTSSGSSPTAGT